MLIRLVLADEYCDTLHGWRNQKNSDSQSEANMRPAKDMFVGAKFDTNNFGLIEIIEYQGSAKVTVRFINSGSVVTVESGAIRKGIVRDYNQPSVCGVGFLGGRGLGKKSKGSQSKPYKVWHGMINRCYAKNRATLYPTYKGCTVAKEWHDFSVFLSWYNENHPLDGKSYDLDKDIKVDGNKVYSPETCLFVTQNDNMVKAFAKSYSLKNPLGGIVEVYNLSDFCRKNDLSQPLMSKVTRGERDNHKGWRLA